MERIVILAGSLREANAYCRDKHIRALFAQSTAQIQKATKIIQLPGFALRRDRYRLEASADARVKYGRDVEFVEETDWVMPRPQPTAPEVEHEMQEGFADSSPVLQLDLTDEAVLEELKGALKHVGLTLKKLPAKKQDEAPVVDAPVEF